MTQTFEEIVKDLDDIEVPEEPKKGKSHFNHPTKRGIAWCGAPIKQNPGKPKIRDSVKCEECMYLLRTVGGREFYFLRGRFGRE